ncbi:MAG: hypothetical protein ABIT20_19710 [Gemmatimonadaceae bacterium]
MKARAFGGLILAAAPGMESLRVGQRFPDMTVRSTDGRELMLPASVAGHDSVLLFYRGHW